MYLLVYVHVSVADFYADVLPEGTNRKSSLEMVAHNKRPWDNSQPSVGVLCAVACVSVPVLPCVYECTVSCNVWPCVAQHFLFTAPAHESALEFSYSHHSLCHS